MPLVAPGPIESPRLLVRLLSEADLPALLEVNAVEEVTRLLPYATWTSMADAEAWHRRMQGIQATGLALQFVIVGKVAGKAIGTCLLFRYEEASRRAELGYALGRAHWGQGLMQEALTALLDTGFGGMGLRRVEAEIDLRNRPSAALVQRLGFTREGVLRERWLGKDGTAGDFAFYGLLAKEWQRAPGDAKA